MHDITAVLVAHRDGDPGAFEQLVGLVYPELRRIARGQLRHWRANGSLETGSVVHEAFLKLVDQTRVNWQDRAHFFAIAARAMRQVIIDYARRRRRLKRGGGVANLDLDAREIAIQTQVEHLLALNDLLARLETVDPRLLQVVECRFFAGYTDTQTADILHVSVRTVERDWRRARAWLKAQLGGDVTASHESRT
jgi:RNA polymerase sigma factor (TIGR02999 family)